MHISTLAEHPESLDLVSTWIHHEFINPDRFTLQQLTARFRSTHHDRIPLCLVALQDDTCVGTVSLFAGDLPARRNLTPWLAALYIPPEQRNRGIGKTLVSACMERAHSLGYNELFLRTEHASGYYRKLGWEHFSDEIAEDGIPTAVYRTPL